MRKVVATVCLLFATAFTASTQESPAQRFFNMVREKVINDLKRAPRYTCVQTITRVQFRPQYPGGRPNSCPALITAREGLSSPGRTLWRDRLRFDVAISDKGEMFSWAGASEFESGDLGDLALSGSTGSGDFATFLTAVFGSDAEQFRYLGPRETPFGLMSAFDFKVPQRKSHYNYKSQGRPSRIIGYEGTFYATPDAGELKRLVIDTREFPPGDPFCHVSDTMDYERLLVGSGDFLLPSLTNMVILYSNGEESHNEKRYSGCKEFTGTSTLRFDDEEDEKSPSAQTIAALKALPAKTRIQVKIDPPIDSDKAAAGDAIIGVVEKEVKQKGQVLVRTTDRLHGRILRFEQFLQPESRWLVALRFDTIERDGVQQRMQFEPMDDGDRTPAPARRFSRGPMAPAALPERPKGGGIFVFPNPGRLVLDKSFHSEWQTR